MRVKNSNLQRCQIESKIIIRKALIDDLNIIQQLNYKLFQLETAEFDDTLITDWALTDNGKEYFNNCIENDIVLVLLQKAKLLVILLEV